MEQKKLVPKRRFAGFHGEWETRYIHEVAKNFYGGGTPKTSVREYWQGDFPWIQSSDLNIEQVQTVIPAHYINDEAIANSATRKIPANSIAIVTRVGVGKLALVPFSYATSQDFLSLSTLLIQEEFAVYVLSRMLQKELNNTQGTSIKGITKDDLLNKKVIIPLKTKEQQNIGQFFNQLDEMIATQQRKVEKTEALKSAYLAEMFPDEGERVPKRRFAGFVDEWKEQMLGEVSEIVRGASPRPIQDPKWFDRNSDIGWLRISDVTGQNGRINYLEQRLSKLGQGKTRVLNEPHLLLSIAATVGRPVINYVKTGVHDGFLIFLNPKFDREFMFQWLEMFRPMWHKYGQPGSQVNLNSDIVRNQVIMLPNLEEQQKIGAFFKQLDNKITNAERKLEKLKATKQAYLQEMFV